VAFQNVKSMCYAARVAESGGLDRRTEGTRPRPYLLPVEERWDGALPIPQEVKL
jgi:hypothetical protein